jgi:ATP-dependent exoDNAse (exonuclease V) beta subunit
MPFADWDFEQRSGVNKKVLWCRPDASPFNKASLVPVEYTKLLLRSRFAVDYMRERFSAYLDNLNLLYVAFTRARERLYVFTPEEKGKELSALLVHTLERVAADGDLPDGEETGMSRSEEGTLFEKGVPAPPGDSRRPEGVNVEEFPAGTALQRLRIAGKGKEYFLLEKGGYKERIDRGTLYHTILAEVVTAADVERAVRKAVSAGLVRAGEREKLVKEVEGFLTQQGAEEWFSGAYQVKTEAEIILPGGKMLRPDRVMIRGDEAVVVDYKFGEMEEEAYVRQVRKYMHVLKNMGYARVRGVIWYVMLQKMTEIDG